MSGDDSDDHFSLSEQRPLPDQLFLQTSQAFGFPATSTFGQPSRGRHFSVREPTMAQSPKGSDFFDYWDKNAQADGGSPASMRYGRKGSTYRPVHSRPAARALQSIGDTFSLAVTDRVVETTEQLTAVSIDTWDKPRAVLAVRDFLNSMGYKTDDDRLVAIVLLLKHFALNSTSNRAPDDTAYVYGNFMLLIRDFMSVLGSELRRCMRAFADDTAAIIRSDPLLQKAISSKHGVTEHEAEFFFDVADARTDLTQNQRDRIEQHKQAVLKRTSEYRARPLAHVDRDELLRQGETVGTIIE